MTRGVSAALQGDFAGAIDMHLAAIPFTLAGLCAMVLLAAELATGKPHLMNTWRRWKVLLTSGAIVVILAGWAVNLVHAASAH